MSNRKPSQKSLVLSHLSLGGSIDAMSAIRLCRCVRLAAIIHILKNEGHEILKQTVVQNDGARLATYSLAR
jgi:hypothetical protein